MKLFKEYKGTSDVSATPYGLGLLLTTVYGESYGVSPVMGEVLIQTISHSTLDYIPANQRGIVQALYYLNSRVESIRKTITTWDAYQIKGALQDRDTILAQLAQLPANSSIVSNLSEPFQWFDGEKEISVFKGDILLKDNEERVVHIPSLSSGYYAPISITRTSDQATTYNIAFHYFTHTPQEGVTEINPGDSVEKPTTEMLFSNIDTYEEFSGYQYKGVLSAGATFIFDIKTDGQGNELKPIVKYFVVDSGEQIYLDKDYSYSTESNEPTKIQLENETPMSIYYEVR